MGMIGRILGGVAGAKLLHGAMNRGSTQSGQYLPANQPGVSSGAVANASDTSIIGKAGRFYAENPKLVHTVGAAALAIALAAFGKRRGML